MAAKGRKETMPRPPAPNDFPISSVPPATACAEPRPQACTMEYIPVCGHRYDGERKTYPNACSACSDPDVAGRDPGPCEEPAPDPDAPPDSTLAK